MCMIATRRNTTHTNNWHVKVVWVSVHVSDHVRWWIQFQGRKKSNRMKEGREYWSESWSKSLNIIISVPLYLWVVSSSEITREMYPGSKEREEERKTIIIIISSTFGFWVDSLSTHYPYYYLHPSPPLHFMPPPNPVSFYFLLLFFLLSISFGSIWRCNNPLPLSQSRNVRRAFFWLLCNALEMCAIYSLRYVTCPSLFLSHFRNRINFECHPHQLTRWLCFDGNVAELTWIMTRSSIFSIYLESVACEW